MHSAYDSSVNDAALAWMNNSNAGVGFSGLFVQLDRRNYTKLVFLFVKIIKKY
jgi:hypothetical protein